MNQFREIHLLNIFDAFDKSTLPLDAFLSHYFRAHKAIGSKDRKTICETIYKVVRWKGLLDYFCHKPITWKSRIDLLNRHSIEELSQRENVPLHIKVSFPKDFFDKICKPFGEQKTVDYCLVSNTQAPTTIRVNPLKTSRESLVHSWKNKFKISVCDRSEHGIVFHDRINFFELEEFKNGFFEIQDEGSQVVASHVKVKPGDHVLDYCAGAGGKTLAFAPNMKESGQIYLYDIRLQALAQAKKRLKRAGIQNAQILTRDKLKKPGLKNRMDWVLLDVPCSGTGTLRRNPDMKWRFDTEMVERLVQEQRKIFQEALKFLAPGGHIVYATCSVLPEENHEQVAFFIKEYNLKLAALPFFTFPQRNGMDGFYAAVLTKA